SRLVARGNGAGAVAQRVRVVPDAAARRRPGGGAGWASGGGGADGRYGRAAAARRLAGAAGGWACAGGARVVVGASGAVRGTREGALACIVTAGRGGGARAEPDRVVAARRFGLAWLSRCLPHPGRQLGRRRLRLVDLRLLSANAAARPRPRAAPHGSARMNTTLALSSLALVSGGLLLVLHALAGRREPLAVRLARIEGAVRDRSEQVALPLPAWSIGLRESYERDLRRAGGEKTLRRFVGEKLVLAPYAAATARPPTPLLILLLALAGFFVPDLLLRQEVRRRREAIFLDLPEAISVLALALGAGQSLRQALELAARDCGGPLATELERALSL